MRCWSHIVRTVTYGSEKKGKVMRERLTKNDVEKIQAEIEHRKLVERKELIEAVKRNL